MVPSVPCVITVWYIPGLISCMNLVCIVTTVINTNNIVIQTFIRLFFCEFFTVTAFHDNIFKFHRMEIIFPHLWPS